MSTCEHQQPIAMYRSHYSASLLRHPLTRWPSITFWELTEDRYEDIVMPDQLLWVTRVTDTIAGKEHITDYLSERIHCEGGIYRACWIRHIVHYLHGEQCPLKWDVDGTTRTTTHS